MLLWIPLLPFLGFLINGLWYAFGQCREGQKAAHATVPGAIATTAIAGSFLLSLAVFIQLVSASPESRMIEQSLFSWIHVGNLHLDAILRVDVLSTLFTLVITGVGTLIHLYSIGYMSHDATPGKFFAYLNLFCFAMLVLVMGGSLPILFFGWEGVGLCSYLLIGYWYEDIEKAKAGKKAFVVNRVGDLGFLLGMFLIFSTFGTLDFVALKQAVIGSSGGAHGVVAGAEGWVFTAIGLLLFIGCMGKSAQVPLYVWLPDAMAGPTPVSALIHAATMVTSGIYLVARLNFIYSLSPTALEVVAGVGVFTAFFAATMAFAQTDIKKVLAYSTVSQLGYMFLGCGVGAYTAGVFHVITHAFFKALLFLGAGSVIHGMHEEQNIMKMGGLRSKMPITFATFLVGWVAIAGIPPFSGFFSKDEILWEAFASAHGSPVFWALAALTAIMTAFYMTRLVYLTFFGESRAVVSKDHGHGHSSNHASTHSHDHEAHEGPMTMTVPLVVLAVLSAVAGFMGVPHASWLASWLEPVIPHHEILRAGVDPSMEWVLMGLSVAGATVGILTAWWSYRDLGWIKARADQWPMLHRALYNKWYIDEIYEAVIVRPAQALGTMLWKTLDVAVIDRAVMGLGWISTRTGQAIRFTQTGALQSYAFFTVIGVLVIVGYVLYGLV